jgi:hypothetical protein
MFSLPRYPEDILPPEEAGEVAEVRGPAQDGEHVLLLL